MSKIWMGPVGRISKGHVLDVSLKPFEQALKDYDAFLYVAWNPKKRNRNGCWEIRRKSEQKTVRPEDVVVFGGATYVFPKYHEINLVNHVLDCEFLNYSVLNKIKSMDAWNMKDMGYKGANFVKQAEYLEGKHLEKIEDEAVRELEYGLKQLKSEVRDFREYVLSGGNPHHLADGWK